MTNHTCDAGPVQVNGKPDTLSEVPDSLGFYSLFNGKDLKGWWENCGSHHSDQDKTNGGLWVVDSSLGVLFSSQNTNGAGSLLSTNKKYDNYELTFEIWPVFGNDAGIFNRCAANGTNWQSGLDYIKGSSIGGSYSENNWSPVGINDDPFMFNDSYDKPNITTWTSFTATQNPASFGCSSGGCTSDDFVKVWNPQGWNQIRVKFYGGLTSGSQVTMETWMRKVQTPQAAWVPIYKSSKSVVTPANPIAFQIHGGTDRWKARSNNLYRNIRVRPLANDGSPLLPVSIGQAIRRRSRVSVSFRDGLPLGASVSRADFWISDAQGRINPGFVGEPAGKSVRFAHPKHRISR